MTQNSPIAFVDTDSGTQLITRLNDVGETIRTTSRGTARPSYAAAGTLWATALDDRDDVALARVLTREVAVKGYIQSRWDDMIEGNAGELRAAGILGSINPATGRSDMVAIQPTIMLALGQGWQNYERIMEDRERAGDLEAVLADLMPKIAEKLSARRARRRLERS